MPQRGGMQYIRDRYAVPAKRGGYVKFEGALAVITSADNGHLNIQFLAPYAGQTARVHPTWHMDYLDEDH